MYINRIQANLAQLVEQLIRNEQVIGSSPIIGSIFFAFFRTLLIYNQPFATFLLSFFENQKNTRKMKKRCTNHPKITKKIIVLETSIFLQHNRQYLACKMEFW